MPENEESTIIVWIVQGIYVTEEGEASAETLCKTYKWEVKEEIVKSAVEQIKEGGLLKAIKVDILHRNFLEKALRNHPRTQERR